MARLLEGHGATHSAPRDPLGAPPALGCQGFRGVPSRGPGHTFLLGQTLPSLWPALPPHPRLTWQRGI